MKTFVPVRLLAPFFAFALLITLFSGCEEECEGILCNPCESSKVLLKYVDNVGDCPSGFDERARVHAFNNGDFNDFAFSFDFADACTAGILIETGHSYVVTDSVMGVSDTIVIGVIEYQPPVAITECCFCYPAEHVHFTINGQTKEAVFSDGEYISTPVTRELP